MLCDTGPESCGDPRCTVHTPAQLPWQIISRPVCCDSTVQRKANGQWPAPVALDELHSNLLALKENELLQKCCCLTHVRRALCSDDVEFQHVCDPQEADEAKVSKSLDLFGPQSGSCTTLKYCTGFIRSGL